MYKLCIALAFLAVAAAKPNLPLAYAGLNEYAYGYPAAAQYPYNYGYNTPLVKTVAAPVVANTYAAPVVAAPAPIFRSVSPLAYSAEVAAPLAYSNIAPLAYHGYAAEPLISYNAGVPLIYKKK